VESAQELLQCRQALDENTVACDAIVPIVETREGMARLPEILSTAVQIGIPAILYGHYDYSLSAGLWPFPEFDETGFWHLADPFIETVESAGLSCARPDKPEMPASVGHPYLWSAPDEIKRGRCRWTHPDWSNGIARKRNPAR
jgi:hypothetical protein